MDLRNNYNVYILGAGFSRAAGLPLLSDFMFKMRDAMLWLPKQGRVAEAKAIERVLEFRVRAASAAYRVPLDLDNIEVLFSLASAIQDPELDLAVKNAITGTLDYCRLTAAPPQSRTVSVFDDWRTSMFDSFEYRGMGSRKGRKYRQYGCQDYDLVAGTVAGQLTEAGAGRSAVISFNYDTVLEQALTRCAFPFSYGTSRVTGYGDSGQGDALPIFKLHGSTNWAEHPDGRGATAFPTYLEARENRRPSVIVPPTWQKVFVGPLADVWRGAVTMLNRATRIIVVGFSIPTSDTHFRYLLSAGLMRNVSLRELRFVGPEPADLEQRTKAILQPVLLGSGTVRFTATTAVDYFTNPVHLKEIGRDYDERFSIY